MRISFDIAGLDALLRDGAAASEELSRDLDSAVQDASEKGLVAFTSSHPYTDRTFNLTASARVEAVTTTSDEFARDMAWGDGDTEYAPYVEAMTAYQFTPAAIEEAQRVLDRDTEYAAELFERKLIGG